MNQHYELLCMGFGEAEYQKIIEDNFMAGYKMFIKPKSEYISHKRKSLTIEEEKKLVDYLMNISYVACSYKYLLLWLLTTGMRIGEALVLDYKKDIILSENKVEIRRTLTINNISMQIMEKTLEYKIKKEN